jgi:hypothetical protein
MMPTTYPYLRVSHHDSARSGLSPGAQLDQCRRYYLHVLVPKKVIWFGLTEIPDGLDLTKYDPELELLYDPAVSARHVPLLQRKGGARLGRMVRGGDHVIFAHLDRGFRAVLDHAALVTTWTSLGITVHYADLGVDLSTPQGMLVANIMAAVAQGHSDTLSERNKEIAARMKKLNRPCNGQKKLGYKLVNLGNHRQWLPDRPERAIMAEITRLRDEEGWSFEAISDSIEQRICEREGRQFRDSAFFKRKWSPSKCRRAYFAYERILEEEGLTSK